MSSYQNEWMITTYPFIPHLKVNLRHENLSALFIMGIGLSGYSRFRGDN